MKSAHRAKRQVASERQPDRSVLQHRRPQREGEGASFTATEAKNEFGRILEKAISGETVVITKHDAPKAVLISMEQFNVLKHAPELKLDTLSGEFDALLAHMQGAKARVRMNAAFHATPQQLGKAAVAAARKRG
jgi:prevent-host-death family protein